MDSIAPFASAEEWDNVGVLVGDMEQNVDYAIVALDCTPDAIKAAKEQSAQLIITHHPAFFKPEDGEIPPFAEHLSRKGLALISAHTNLDKAESGVNRCLCEKLGLDAHPSNLDPLFMEAELKNDVPLDDFALLAKEKLCADSVRIYSASSFVKKLAVCCGSGGDFLQYAAQSGCDTLLTGDIKHHVFIEAAHLGINIIDAGHYATEDIIIEPLAESLRQKFPDIKFIAVHSKPFRAI